MDEIKTTQDFIEVCKMRFAESQRRFQAANQRLQQAQQEFGQAQAEHNNWHGVLNSESARLARLQHAAQANQGVLPMPPTSQTVAPTSQTAPTKQAATTIVESGSSDINKTELVRELLAQHPEGMTPGDIWTVLREQVPRPYLYSILKRLKDADEVIYQRRRKRYSLRVAPKHEDASKEQQAGTLVH